MIQIQHYKVISNLFSRMDVEGAEELYSAYGGQTPTSKSKVRNKSLILV